MRSHLHQAYGNVSMLTEDVRRFLSEEKWRDTDRSNFRIIDTKKEIVPANRFQEITSQRVKKIKMKKQRYSSENKIKTNHSLRSILHKHEKNFPVNSGSAEFTNVDISTNQLSSKILSKTALSYDTNSSKIRIKNNASSRSM
jgi:hypothetical protein